MWLEQELREVAGRGGGGKRMRKATGVFPNSYSQRYPIYGLISHSNTKKEGTVIDLLGLQILQVRFKEIKP